MEESNITQLSDQFRGINLALMHNVELFATIANTDNKINDMPEEKMHMFYEEFGKISDALLNIGNMLLIHDQL